MVSVSIRKTISPAAGGEVPPLSKQRRCKENYRTGGEQLRDINIYPMASERQGSNTGRLHKFPGCFESSIEGGGNPQGCNDQHNNAGFEFSCNQERNTGADPMMTTERRKRLAKAKKRGRRFFPRRLQPGPRLVRLLLPSEREEELPQSHLAPGNEKEEITARR